MRIKRISVLTVKYSAILLFLIGLYLFFFGRLNFINPWVVGFDKMETKRAIIYYHRSEVNITCLSKIDSLIIKVEEFHKLRYPNKLEVVISTNIKEHKRYTWNYGTFISQPFYGRLYILYIEDYFLTKTQPLYAYIQHELSHSIIFQNISYSKLLNYPLWFMEGLATYSSGMMGIEGYPTKDAVVKRMSEGYFIHPNDWGEFGLPSTGITVKQYPFEDMYWFAYSEFAFIIDNLVDKYGKSKLIDLMHLTLRENNFEDAFLAIYKIKFDSYIDLLSITK
jgi:hypothetical protein